MRKALLLFSCLTIAGLPTLAAELITTVEITGGLTDPVGVTNAGDGIGRLFIVEQHGRIRIWNGSQLLAAPFLDVSSAVGPCPAPPTGCSERGLLGLAFHPSYETNGFFYVFYTRASDGDVVVARYHVSTNPDVADAASGTVLITVEHSQNSAHNGGQIAFGPDGYLYVAIGDAGGGSGPVGNGQNLNVLLGKILRLDVDADDFPADPSRNYAIPADNPFAGAVPGADEIWAYGFRNPWRFSFDRATGDLYIGDVGQLDWEEVDFQPFGSAGGVNYGWDCREGTHAFAGSFTTGCGSIASVDPILEYSHAENGPPCASVTGGFVYHNLPLHSLFGDYLFADFCTGRIWRGTPSGGAWTRTEIFHTPFNVSSFGEGESGRVYFTDLTADDLRWLAPYSFADVPPTAFAWQFIEAVHAASITAGCGVDNFCPDAATTRAEMAVFLLVAAEDPGFTPPPCASPLFADVPCSDPFAPWINELARRGVTAGCGGGNYCPNGSVTREQMSVFLLATKEGSSFVPPACTAPLFADVPCASLFAPWVNEAARRGITAGCGGGNYCPADAVTRAQMAVFLSTTFALKVP